MTEPVADERADAFYGGGCLGDVAREQYRDRAEETGHGETRRSGTSRTAPVTPLRCPCVPIRISIKA